MSKKKPFETVKVIDPHKNMPKDIARCLLDGKHDNDDMMSNDSFIWWTVGEYQHVTDEIDDEELEGPGDRDLKKVDDWMIESGLKLDEEVLVLYWW
ncbi:MAG: hypothetical protein AB7I18_14600 [Candidatus Berkiella sp.]